MPTALRSILRASARAAAVAALTTIAARAASAQHMTPAPTGHKAGDVVPLIGVQYGAPERLAGILGVGVATAGSGDSWAGYALLADVGPGGVRLSVATVDHGTSGLGAQVRLTAIRSWRNSAVVAPNQTFAGPEVRVSLTALTVGAGYYWRTAGLAPGDRRFAAVTFGLQL